MSCFYLPLLGSHIPIEPSALPHVHTRIYQKRKSIGLEEKLRLSPEYYILLFLRFSAIMWDSPV